MSIVKNIILIGISFSVGIYIEKSNEDSKIKKTIDDIFYKIKPIFSEIKTTFFDFVAASNLDVDFDEIFLNSSIFLETLKNKLQHINEIDDLEEKLKVIKEEILFLLLQIKNILNHDIEEYTMSTNTKIITTIKTKEEG